MMSNSETMRAAWYERQGPARQVIEVGRMAKPQPGPGDVRVRLHASGINPSDVKRRTGFGGMPMEYPRIVPHQDGAGIVEAVGEGVPPARIGERVWLYETQHGRAIGTAAEFAVVPARQALPLPSAVTFAEGAALAIPYMTAHRALFADGSIAGQTVFVPGGAGAVGNAAIQLAKWGGAASVIATVSRPEQAAVARAAGADHVIDRKREDVAARVMEVTAGAGVDRIVEISPEQNFAVALKVLKVNGVVSIYAMDRADSVVPAPLLPLLRNAVTLRWVYIYRLPQALKDESVRDIGAALAAGALHPHIGARFPLEAVAEAHDLLDSGSLIGKAVIDIGSA
ncbi:MAG: NADPH:quinone reductase [Rhodospirillaceae bacterium]|nr:NADPH:quinone reductase [Rhodospirillaceae bacterium]